jgi:tetratricopeptide (TPR) repeat protein
MLKLLFMKKLLVFILGILLVSPLTSLVSQAEDLTIADKQYELKNYGKAASVYQSILLADPQNTQILTKLALSYKYSNQTEQALKVFSEFVDKPSTDMEVLFEYADLLRSSGNFETAKLYFEKYAVHNPVVGAYFAQTCDFAQMQLKQPSYCKLKNLESNTQGSDFAPVAVGEDLLFASERVLDQNVKSASRVELFKTNITESGNQAITASLRDVLNKESQGLGNVSFSEDGREVAFSKSAELNENAFLQTLSPLEIYFADINERESWTNIRPFEYNQKNYSFGFPSLANSGKTMYFASNMPGGFGGYDLYVSHLKDDDKWSEPLNLGAIINTPGNEISPYHKDQLLFFSSDWHQGFGGFDVFKTKQRGDVWEDVQNMGTCVNSTMDEYYFILDPNGNGYFTSNRFGGKGGEDIYQSMKLKLPKDASGPAILDTEIGEIGLNTRTSMSTSGISNAQDAVIFDDPSMLDKKDAQANKLYFVQITSLTKYSDRIEERFKKYAVYGDVYRVNADGVTKIRIGSFADVNEAVALMNLLKKNGIKDAFIITDVIDPERTYLISKANAKVSKTDQQQAENVVFKEEGSYKIRVAEYKAPDWFDISKINDLGNIEHWTKSGWTIIVLGNYLTETAAKDVISKLKARGFKESYIVVEENGKLFRL